MKTKVDFMKAEAERIEGILKDPLLDEIVAIMDKQLESKWIGNEGEILDESLSWAFQNHLPDLHYSIALDKDHIQGEYHRHHWEYTMKQSLPASFTGHVLGFLPYPKHPIQKKRIENYMEQIIGPPYKSKEAMQRRWFNHLLQKSSFTERFVTLVQDKGFVCKITTDNCCVTVRVIVR